MMFFGKGKKKSNNEGGYIASPSKVTLDKAKVNLDKHIVQLKEDKNIDLSNHRARVFVVIDRSGSMETLYRNGSVQEVLTRLLPLALRFDDNGELEVYLFNTKCTKMPAMNLKNYEDYVERIIMRKHAPYGGTSYSPVIEQTVSDYNDGSPYPAFGMFITDGECDDEDATSKAIQNSSEHKIFYQIFGIGYEKFNYLRKLDNLEGRSVDNTSFVKVSDLAKLDDEQLYEKLLGEYPQWLKAMKIY